MLWNKKIRITKKMVVLGSLIVIIFSTGIVYNLRSNKVKPKEVSIDTSIKRNISETATETGNIEPNYRNNIALNSSQKVLKITVKEGDMVKKGDLLILLDVSEYEIELEKQKINLANAQLTLDQMLKTGINKDKSASETSLSQAKYDLENAQRKYDDLNKKYEQKKTLFDRGAIAQSELDDAKKNKEDAETSLKSAQNSVSNAEVILKDTDISSESKIAAQKNQIALIQKDLDNYQKKIDDSKIVSNIDGKVIKIDAKESQFPKTGDEIIIDDISQYKVSVDLKQYDTLKVAKNQKVTISIKGSNNLYNGTVSDIGEYAEVKTNTGNGNQENKVKVTAILTNPTDEVKPGYEADVQFVFKERENCLAIGFDGIKEDKVSGEKYVYIIDSNNKISKRYVKTGIQSDYYVEITDGLNEGDKYVLNPPENLKDGDLVVQGSSGKTAASTK